MLFHWTDCNRYTIIINPENRKELQRRFSQKKAKDNSCIPHQLRISIYYFRTVKFYNYETIILLADGANVGCISLYYFSKLLYDRVLKYLPVSPFGLVRISPMGSIESLLFYYSSQIATYGYFLPCEYLVRRKVLSEDYITVSEYYSRFLEKYPYLALPLDGNKSTGLAFIRFPELSPSVRS